MKLYIGVKAVITEGEKALIIREAAYAEGTSEGMWDVPGGRINPEETLPFALQREVREECGLEIEIGPVLGVAESFIVINNETCHVVRIYYQCEKLPSEVRIGNDHDKYVWVERREPGERLYVGEVAEMIKKTA